MSSIVMEEYELLGDSKYRSYMSLVDKALKAFDYTTEWADLIAALGKLNKVLLAHMKYPIVPRRVVISKRLAQCMHPALPSGVHLKALETYDVIFKCMGTNRLAQELFLYSAGLFPLLGHAAMNVRPALLTVYETHFVPLGQRLRPALNGFLSGVLPGLEEGSDHFERTNKLLESVCEATSPAVFYGSLWECMCCNASIRLPAVAFVLQHLDRRRPVAEQAHLLGGDGDVMVQAVCAAVQDVSVLVQRNALDLLILAFPLHDTCFLQDQDDNDDLVRVVAAACTVLLRRDMSLNRRLFNWLLGCDVNASSLPTLNSAKINGHVRQDSVSSTASIDSSGGSNNASLYFEFYSKSVLVEALVLLLSDSLEGGDDGQPDLRPFRLLVTLLDKPEIGPLVMDEVIVDVFRTLYHAHKKLSTDEEGKKSRQELVKSSNLLFASFESSYIWEFCGRRFEAASAAEERMNDTHEDVNRVGYDQGATVVEMCAIIDFLLDIVSIETYVETYSEQLPALFKTISRAVAARCSHLTAREISKSMLLCRRVLSKVQPAWTAWEVQGGGEKAEQAVDAETPQEGGSDVDSMETVTTAVQSTTEEDQASKMWSQVGKGLSGEAKKKKSRSADSSPELGREATESMPSSPQPPTTTTQPQSATASPNNKLVHQQHERLMQECVQAFQELFIRVVGEKLLDPDKLELRDCLSMIVQRPRNTLEERTRQLESLLEERTDSLARNRGDAATVKRSTDDLTELDAEEDLMLERMSNISVHLRTDDDISELSKAVTTACQVLVELSSIPTVRKKGRDESEKVPQHQSPHDLPKWLQLLLICSCMLGRDQAILQLNCVGTLMELISLLQSTLAASRDGESRRSNVSIVMMPLVKESHYRCVMSKTVVPQVIASRLWEGLGTLPPNLHLKCVTLLHQLHNLVPDARQIERILARSLGGAAKSDRGDESSIARSHSSTAVVDAYQRFTLLWHLSRDQESKRAAGRAPARTFDICLLKMLDNLNLSSGPLKALSQSWLVHAVAKGDLARLMEPLFLTLLDPSTARVSVLHAKIEQIDTVDGAGYGDEGIHLVYSIRSSNQEVIYHVSEKQRRSDARNTNHKGASDRAKKAFALARFKNPSSTPSPNPLASPVSRGGDEGNGGVLGLSAIPLLVNPFALVPTDLDEFAFYTKGYTSKAERSPSTSTASSSTSSTSSPTSSVDASFEVDAGTGVELVESQGRTIVEQILAGVVCRAVDRVFDQVDDSSSHNDLDDDSPTKTDTCSPRSCGHHNASSSSGAAGAARSLNIHPMHSHLLLYTQVCDSRQVLYAMQCVKNILLTNPRLSLCMLSTTKLNSGGASSSPRSPQLHMLLARHRKSVFGKNFAGELAPANMATYRNANLIEVLISTLLYFLRSYYPNLGHTRLTEEEILSNREVQLISIDILSVLVSELVSVVQDNSRAYATYISDLFSRCKVQKVVLHSLLACINDMRDSPRRRDEQEVMAFTEDVLRFNEIYSTPGASGQSGSSERISNYSEAFQVQVLRLLLALVMLEQSISQQRGQMPPEKLKPLHQSQESDTPPPSAGPTSSSSSSSHVLRYHSDHDIPDQPMFLAAIVSALRQEKMRHLHSHWTSLFTSCLPFLGRSLSQSVLEVTAQLSKNLENLAGFYHQQQDQDLLQQDHVERRDFGQIPADYVVTQMEALTMIYHYCLLDNQSNAAGVTQSPTQQSQQPQPNANSSQSEILTNLLHVFLSNTDSKNLSAQSVVAPASVDTLAIARKILLSTLPRLVETVAVLWRAVGSDRNSDTASACVLVGSPRAVRSRLLDLVSPIAAQHPAAFLSAVAIDWQERRKAQGNLAMAKHPLPHCNEEQKVLVDLCGAIRSLPVPTVLQNVRQVLKSPPNVGGQATSSQQRINVEVSVMQFFYNYLAQCSAAQVQESWSSLLGLLRDCLSLAPPALFLALSVLNQFVLRAPAPNERREQKELQEVAGKLIEACANIGGSCLEQTTWLRRNLQVNPDLLADQERQAELDLIESKVAVSASTSDSDQPSSLSSVVSDTSKKNNNNNTAAQFAVPALALLGELLAPFLDIIYQSEEKDRVVPLLHSVMYNVMPYLRNHSRGNAPSFRACSKLLASLSEYQYTRKAWKKDAVELLLDSAFFQMDLPSLQHWRVTVDNLMTHDKTTFKELMTKVSSISQSGSLTQISIFSSKEQELEQRCLLLKRLAFVIFCSEVDQYQKQMPDIQERLAESLRTIPTSPAVQASVFLCFRVLLVRMSPHHVTSMWPLVITEMVQIFSYLEQELSTDSEEWSDPQKANSTHLKRLSTLDTSWVVSAGSNGLVAHNSPQWMALYLQVCKLLDLALAMPALELPQFQMYRWAFVSESNDPTASKKNSSTAAPVVNGGSKSNQQQQQQQQQQQDFVPYVVRVAKLLLSKMEHPVSPSGLTEGEPQLTMTSIASLDDLAPFFASICTNVTRQQARSGVGNVKPTSLSQTKKNKNVANASRSRQVINALIEKDFLEALTK